MRLRTIWTLPTCTLREKIRRTNELIIRKLAHNIPDKFAYWIVNDRVARYINIDEVVPEVTAMDILKRMHDDSHLRKS